MFFRGLKDQQEIFKKWAPLVNYKDDLKDETMKMSTAIIL